MNYASRIIPQLKRKVSTFQLFNLSTLAFAVAAIEGVRVRQPFHPGDKLVTVASIVRERVPLGTYSFKGYRNGEPNAKGEPAVECTVKCMLGSRVKGL